MGDFWSQVIYFVAVFGGVIGLALRSRAKDEADPSRLARGGPAITPAGLPGPFVVTQAMGVLAVAMLAVGYVVGGNRGLIWAFSAMVLGLVGLVGLVFWLFGLRRGSPADPFCGGCNPATLRVPYVCAAEGSRVG